MRVVKFLSLTPDGSKATETHLAVGSGSVQTGTNCRGINAFEVSSRSGGFCTASEHKVYLSSDVVDVLAIRIGAVHIGLTQSERSALPLETT